MTTPDPASAHDATVFEAVLHPHRSLSPYGFRLLLIGVGLCSTILSVPFFLLGAWPVIGFFGLDIGALYILFRLNYRDARRSERLQLTYAQLLIERVDPYGRRRAFIFNPLWLHLSRDEHEEFGTLRLAVVQREREVEIARCLGPQARSAFADTFARALGRARRGPDINPL